MTTVWKRDNLIAGDNNIASIPVARMSEDDLCQSAVGDVFYVHKVITTGGAESSPDLITPDDAEGARVDWRWSLMSMASGAGCYCAGT